MSGEVLHPEVLLDPETGEVLRQLTEQEARELTEKIVRKLNHAWDGVVLAFKHRAWLALGFESWDAYCTASFPQHIMIPREERAEAVQSLRSAGLSIRAIAAVTGHSKSTIGRDAGVPNGTPQSSPDASSAPGDRTGSIGSTPAAPGATSPGQNIEPSADDADGSPGQPTAADLDDPDKGVGDSGSSPVEEPESPADLVERACRARTRTHDLIGKVDAAALVGALDLDGLVSWDLTVAAMERWIDAYTTARKQLIRRVQ